MQFKFPPIVVFCAFAIGMYALDRFLPVGDFEFFGRWELSFILPGIGFVLGLVAVYQFRRSRTSIDPLVPQKAKTMVDTGVYQFSRNPMYLALLLVLIGFGLRLGNAFNALLAAGFVYYMNHFQIRKEEEVLLKKFGKEYRLYCKAVRRWF